MLDIGALIIALIAGLLAFLIGYVGARQKDALFIGASAPAWSFAGVYLLIFIAELQGGSIEPFRFWIRYSVAGSAIIGLAFVIVYGFTNGLFRNNRGGNHDGSLVDRASDPDYLAEAILREHERAKSEIEGRKRRAGKPVQINDRTQGFAD